MTTKEFNYFDRVQDVDIEENLTEEELRNLEIETAKAISKNECSDKNINVSFIALNELKSMGFKNDVSTFFLSKLIEDLYHERKEFDGSDYFDLKKKDNVHYSNLLDQLIIGDQEFYKIMINRAIKESNCETKDINEIVYGIVGLVSKKINNSNKIRLEA